MSAVMFVIKHRQALKCSLRFRSTKGRRCKPPQYENNTHALLCLHYSCLEVIVHKSQPHPLYDAQKQHTSPPPACACCPQLMTDASTAKATCALGPVKKKCLHVDEEWLWTQPPTSAASTPGTDGAFRATKTCPHTFLFPHIHSTCVHIHPLN